MKMMDISCQGSTRLLERSALWQREVNTLTPLDMQVFLREHWGSYHYSMAVSEVETIIKAIWDEVLYGKLEDLPQVAFFTPPRVRMTSSEFSTYLSALSFPHRRAVIFALETNLSIEKIVDLTHDSLELIEGLVSEIAMSAARSQPRHSSLPNVFWQEEAGGVVSPLHDLADAVFDVSQGMGVNSLRRLYQNMICIDQDSDLAQFSMITQIPLSLFKTLH